MKVLIIQVPGSLLLNLLICPVTIISSPFLIPFSRFLGFWFSSTSLRSAVWMIEKGLLNLPDPS